MDCSFDAAEEAIKAVIDTSEHNFIEVCYHFPPTFILVS